MNANQNFRILYSKIIISFPCHGRYQYTSFILIFIVFCLACFATSTSNAQSPRSIQKAWDELGLSSLYHVGISIYNPENERWVFQHRADNFFTPASNVKILTMFCALQYLDEIIPGAYYQVSGDSLIIWGGGDPGTYYPDIHNSSPLITFLRDSDKKIIFSDAHFLTGRYGRGWAWDDYDYSFQAERTAFPIYGNRLWIERFGDSLSITPTYIDPVLSIRKDTFDLLTRNEWGTQYQYHYNFRKPMSIATEPLSLYRNDIRFIWKAAIGKEIVFENRPFPKNAAWIGGSHRDTLLKEMMHESDNFIAEQLLLACALRETGSMNEADIINIIKSGPLSQLPDSLYWVDGSGLSRYNLVTPQSIVWVLDKILDQKGLPYFQEIFPGGGMSGTIKGNYKSGNAKPYIYAKTGNLRNQHSLSGILITRSGKVLLFSWMHNQYTRHSSEIRIAMEKFFNWLRDNY